VVVLWWYHTFYRALPRTDYLKVAERLIPWLEEHNKGLPTFLHLDRQLVRESLQTLVVLTSRKPVHRCKPDDTPPISFIQDFTLGQIRKAARRPAN
jgi:hypothetical protein